jgi:VanZ family protein
MAHQRPGRPYQLIPPGPRDLDPSVGRGGRLPAAAARVSDRRVARILLLLWCGFIGYGSFIPFHLTFDPALIGDALARVQLSPFRDGRRAFSIPDVVSNVLLFVPFGALLAYSRRRGGAGRSIALGAGSAFGFAVLIEIAQLLSPGRTSSLVDVTANTIGAVAGATAIWLLVGERVPGRERLLTMVRADPVMVPAALLAATLLAEATYPFAVTLDVSTFWGNLKSIDWRPFSGSRAWSELLVERLVRWAVLGVLLERIARRWLSGRSSWSVAGAGVLAFAVAVELSKLFVAGRFLKLENALVAAVGGILGVTLFGAAMRSRALAGRPGWVLLALTIVLLVYWQLAPFEFVRSSGAIAANAARIEWLPLRSYYGADPQSALFDLWEKLFLSGAFGFAVAMLTGGRGAVALLAGLALGVGLEAAQLFTPSRHPSVSDVVTFVLGTWVGAKGFGGLRRSARRAAAAGTVGSRLGG